MNTWDDTINTVKDLVRMAETNSSYDERVNKIREKAKEEIVSVVKGLPDKSIAHLLCKLKSEWGSR